MTSKMTFQLYPTYADPKRWRSVKPVQQTKEEWQEIRRNALERDRYTCQYCGHRAEKYQIVHHLDEDPSNNSLENLTVICQMCNVVMHAGQGCVIQGVVDLYRECRFSQADIIRITTKMRFIERKSDPEITAYLGLHGPMPFRMSKKYLRPLFGFVSSRSGVNDDMYENWRRYETARSPGVE